jgi:hypothetical protein
MTFVADLEPKSLWAHFDQILMIPRGSKNEDKMDRRTRTRYAGTWLQ